MPAKLSDAEVAQLGMSIARRSAARDFEGVRETLLRLGHDWSPVSQSLHGQFIALLNDLDELAGRVALVDVEVS